ncbi:MAG: hypothetical protein ACQEVA_02405 [Myxococcota bacterium]
MEKGLNIVLGAVAAAVVISILACTPPKTGPQTDDTVYEPYGSDTSSQTEPSGADAGSSATVNLSETSAEPGPGLTADRLDVLTTGLESLRTKVRARATDQTRWAELVPEGEQLRYYGPQPDADQKVDAAGLAATMSDAYADGVCIPARAECFSHCCSYQPTDGECAGSAQTASAACFKGETAEALMLSELWLRCPLRYAVEDIDAKPSCLTDFEVRTPTENICSDGATLQLFMKNNCSGPLEAGKQRIGANDKTGFVLGDCDDETCDFKLFGTAGAKPLDIKVRVRARTNAPSNFEAELVQARVR